jgi:hypothetical protein
VYLVKYYTWLNGRAGDPADVAEVLAYLAPQETSPDRIDKDMSELEDSDLTRNLKIAHVYDMAERAYGYALSLW